MNTLEDEERMLHSTPCLLQNEKSSLATQAATNVPFQHNLLECSMVHVLFNLKNGVSYAKDKVKPKIVQLIYLISKVPV